MNLAIAPRIAFPGGNTGPLVQYDPFRLHVEKAISLTNTAIVNLAPQKPGVENIMDPYTVASASAQAAVKELGFALDQDAPAAGLSAAQAGLKLIEQGSFEMTHRLNGPLNTDRVVGEFTAGEQSLQSALDSIGFAQSR